MEKPVRRLWKRFLLLDERRALIDSKIVKEWWEERSVAWEIEKKDFSDTNWMSWRENSSKDPRPGLKPWTRATKHKIFPVI